MSETQDKKGSTPESSQDASSGNPFPQELQDAVSRRLLSIDPFSSRRQEELTRRRESGELCRCRYEPTYLSYLLEEKVPLDRHDLDSNLEAVELTRAEVEQIGGMVAYINAAGRRVEITPESFPSPDAVLILFPEDLGM